MSLTASRWAWNASAGGAKVMLLALAEHADQSGYCFPSLQRLARMCEISESTAHRMVNSLASRKLITIERRFNENGSCRSNGYWLAIVDHPVKLTGRGVALAGGVVSSVTGGGVSDGRVTTTESVLYEAQRRLANEKASAPDRKLCGGHPLCFPSAISEAQRAAIGAQVSVLGRDDAQQILDELAGRMDTMRVRNPVGYCAKLVERFKRGEFHPVAGLPVANQRQVNEREQRTILGARPDHSPGGQRCAHSTPRTHSSVVGAHAVESNRRAKQ